MAFEKIAIIAGQGTLPQLIINACIAQGRPFCVVAIEGNTPSNICENHETIHTSYGKVGATLQAMRSHDVTHVVMAGKMSRPSLGSLRLDAKGAKLLARIGRGLFSGDDRLLRAITDFFEEEGFRVMGADEILEDAVTPPGTLGQHAPSAADMQDIWVGVSAARALGLRDAGQAVIVQAGAVLGEETSAGTDALIATCQTLKMPQAGGVLVKVKKPQQERRADLPAIGMETVRLVAQAGFSGIALEAGHSLILSRADVVAAADAEGIFLYGITESDS
ncbi:MAG: UDP-2,3-diacylglucosamine diphosphatase LpxI [Rickettsiales bacterium]|nr:UDP-2,3-diacylglucosamine diphosphatase LpxI [Rickettsiales bacterium]